MGWLVSVGDFHQIATEGVEVRGLIAYLNLELSMGIGLFLSSRRQVNSHEDRVANFEYLISNHSLEFDNL